MPRLFACGGRDSAFDDFRRALRGSSTGEYVGLLIDSEAPLADLEATWDHLKSRDGWERPTGAADDQVLFMTTCMETWIVADREALQQLYGAELQESALPPLVNLEERDRHRIQDSLIRATRKCSNSYVKGKRSYQVLAALRPDVLENHLPSFARALRILDDKL